MHRFSFVDLTCNLFLAIARFDFSVFIELILKLWLQFSRNNKSIYEGDKSKRVEALLLRDPLTFRASKLFCREWGYHTSREFLPLQSPERSYWKTRLYLQSKLWWILKNNINNFHQIDHYQQFRDRYFMSIDILKNERIKVMYSSHAVHSGPIAMNLLHNSLLRKYNCDDCKIILKSRPLINPAQVINLIL